MLLHQRRQNLSFSIVVEPQGKVNKQTGKDAAEERTLSVKAYGFASSPRGSEPSQSAHCVRSQIPLFVTYGDIFPRSGGSLSSQGELFGIFRQVEQNLPLSGEVARRKP